MDSDDSEDNESKGGKSGRSEGKEIRVFTWARGDKESTIED